MDAESKSEKTCQIWLFLFGKPAWELDLEGAEADGTMVRALEQVGVELKERLHVASVMTKILLENGWTGSGGLYDIMFYKGVSLEEARKELVTLGLNPDKMNLEEEEWDEDEQ